MGHSQSMKMSPFDRSCTSSYWRSIVTMALSCVISEMNRDIGHTRMALKYNLNLIVENRDFLCPPALDAPLGSSSRNIAVAFGTEKNRMVGLPEGDKVWRYPFWYNTWMRQTDRQDVLICYWNTLRMHVHCAPLTYCKYNPLNPELLGKNARDPGFLGKNVECE